MINTPAGVWGQKTARRPGKVRNCRNMSGGCPAVYSDMFCKKARTVLCRMYGYGFGILMEDSYVM